jgi:protease-4
VEIDSPGGSPVQAGEIYDEIQKLRQQYPKIPIHAVAGDVCASGGYYIAAAAQKIYANKASIVGSIGVRMDSFGFTDAIAKLGVERRAYTAGSQQGLPRPVQAGQSRGGQASAGDAGRDSPAVHYGAVKQGRGERLKDNPEVFSGLMWTGEQRRRAWVWWMRWAAARYGGRRGDQARRTIDGLHQAHPLAGPVV